MAFVLLCRKSSTLIKYLFMPCGKISRVELALFNNPTHPKDYTDIWQTVQMFREGIDDIDPNIAYTIVGVQSPASSLSNPVPPRAAFAQAEEPSPTLERS